MDTGDSHKNHVRSAILGRKEGILAGLRDRVTLERLEILGDHLDHLAETISLNSLPLFVDYLAWSRLLARHLPGCEGEPAAGLEELLLLASDHLESEVVATMRDHCDRGLVLLKEKVVDEGSLPETTIDLTARYGRLAREYLDLLLEGKRRRASELILGSVSTGISIRDIYLHVFAPVQRELGFLWQTDRLTVAREHFCTATTQMVMSQLYPHFLSMESSRGKIVSLSVAGELHEVGIRMVSDLLEMEGWETYYVGANTPSHNLCRILVEEEATILAVSATMTTHVAQVKELIGMVRANPLCQGVSILVGGYPFNVEPELWRRIGADGYAPDVEAIGEVAGALVAA